MKRLIYIANAVVFVFATACGGASTDAERGDGTESERESVAARADERSGSKKKNGPESQKAERKKGSLKGGSAAAGQLSGKAAGDASAAGERRNNVASRKGSGSAASASPAAPIPAGTHAYATEGYRSVSGNRASLPETTTLSTETPRDGLQRQVRDLRDEDGYGTVTESHLLYRPEGVFLIYVKVTSSFPGGFTDVREFKLPRPELLAPTEGGPGFERSFSMRGSGTRADVHIAARREGTVTVSDRSVRAVLVDTTIVFSGALEGEQRSASWYYPKHLLVLREHVRTDVRNGPVRLQGEYNASLKRLP